MEGPITKFKASKKMNSNIVGLILIGVTVVLAIVIPIAVIIMGKFWGDYSCARYLMNYSRRREYILLCNYLPDFLFLVLMIVELVGERCCHGSLLIRR